ncbi:phenoloxidase-activating factor 2-like isoform X2 [Drosophila subpulchrella]|nr:phenoloxidase-activating factor 2-like isoform X2 [Drosophila subpulchrella]
MAQENEFPWMVALLDATYKNYVAGGALIAFHVVISVRGKIDNKNPEQLLVRAGEWDFKVQTEQYPHVDVEVKQIVRHPDFDFNNGANNVALLFLKRSLKADIHINPICLPERPKNFDYSRCIFTGWGKKSFEDYTHMNILKKIELPVVQSSTCQNAINQYLPYKFVLHNSLMCAGGENDKDSCTDDGGSPLACPIQGQPGRYELAGLVNFGLHCGLPGVPGVYVNVANLRQWIEKETAEGPSPDDIQEIPLKPFNTHGWNLNEANKSLAYGNGNGQNEIIGQHYPVNNSPSQPDNADEWVVQEPNQNDAFGDGNAQNNFVNWYPQQNGASAQENNQRDQYSGNSENWDTSTMGYEYN